MYNLFFSKLNNETLIGAIFDFHLKLQTFYSYIKHEYLNAKIRNGSFGMKFSMQITEREI